MKLILCIFVCFGVSFSCASRQKFPQREPHEARLPDQTAAEANPPPAAKPADDHELDRFKTQFLDKSWKICFSQDVSSSRLEVTFKSDKSYSAMTSNFESSGVCKGKAEPGEQESGTFELSVGKVPGQFFLDTFDGKQQRYELISIIGDTLMFGREDGLDGTSPDKRPTKLDRDGYRADGTLPIFTL